MRPYRNLCTDVVSPDGIEWIAKLNSPLTHVEDEHGQTAHTYTAQLFPVTSQSFTLDIIL